MLRCKRVLVQAVLSTGLMLCISTGAISGEIGTTADGNVIYLFTCPHAAGEAKLSYPKVDWDNHLKDSDGLEWDSDNGTSGFGGQFHIRPLSVVRNGQVIACTFEAKIFGMTRRNAYRYKVKRDIIQCNSSSSYQIRCILRDSASGSSGNSASTGSAAPDSGESSSTECCHVKPSPQLKGRLGRLTVEFPSTAVLTGARIAVLKDEKELQVGFGSRSWELLPGSYDILISGKQVSNVTVKSGHDTTVKVGVLHISSGKETRAAVLDGGKEIVVGFGDQVIGLPPGSFDVYIAGQTERVSISEGRVTEF